MFCTIKYAGAEDEEKEFYVNLDCALKFILKYIQDETAVEGEFDLCDWNGELQYVSEYELHKRGNTILKEFEDYIVVSVERNDNGSFSKLVPLLPNNQKRIEIEHKLNLYVKPSKRFTYELKKARSTRSSIKNLSNSSKKQK